MASPGLSGLLTELAGKINAEKVFELGSARQPSSLVHFAHNPQNVGRGIDSIKTRGEFIYTCSKAFYSFPRFFSCYGHQENSISTIVWLSHIFYPEDRLPSHLYILVINMEVIRLVLYLPQDRSKQHFIITGPEEKSFHMFCVLSLSIDFDAFHIPKLFPDTPVII